MKTKDENDEPLVVLVLFCVAMIVALGGLLMIGKGMSAGDSIEESVRGAAAYKSGVELLLSACFLWWASVCGRLLWKIERNSR